MISVFHSNYSTFAQVHNDAIVDYCDVPTRKKLKLSTLDKHILSNFGTIITTFSELLLATPQQLFDLKATYDKMKPNQQEEVKKHLGMKGMYNKFIDKNCEFMYKGSQYNSNYLADKNDIKTCPYCNENTTYSFYYKTTKSYRRTFDWDHIIPKEEYPFLAISFYNLVPACKVCNFLKIDRIILASPHSNFNPDLTYTFKVKGKHTDFITDTSSLNLLMKVKKNPGGKALIDIIDKVGLDARLATQMELVRDILNKKILYKSAYWKSLEDFVSVSSGKKINLLNLFFSAQFNHEEYYKRQYSKLISDLIKK